MSVPELYGFALSIFTLIGLGWKGSSELQKLRSELSANTKVTEENKSTTQDTNEILKTKVADEFVKLQRFNGARYREIYLAQLEQQTKIESLIERIKVLEERLNNTNEKPTGNNQPKEFDD